MKKRAEAKKKYYIELGILGDHTVWEVYVYSFKTFISKLENAS